MRLVFFELKHIFHLNFMSGVSFNIKEKIISRIKGDNDGWSFIHLVASKIPALHIAVLIILKTSSLVHLNARSTGLNEQALLIVGRALRLGSNLVTLHLENCGVYGRCLVILVAALKLNTTLRELFLAENKISPADGFQLGNLLRTNTHLELLDLSNKLGDEGLVHVMESLGQQSNTSGRGLSTLILWNNELTVKGMPCILRALYFQELKEKLTSKECIVLADFAENYTCTIQDEIRSYHWNNNQQATIN